MMTLDPQQKPEIGDVDKFVAAMEEDYAGARTEWAKAADFYLSEYELWPKLSAEERAHRPASHSAIAASVIDQATDAISTFAPIVTRPPTAAGASAQTEADDVENGAKDMLVDAFVTASEHAAKQSARHGVLFNWMGLSTRLKRGIRERPERKEGEDLEDFQEREQGWGQEQWVWNPISIEALRPGEVLMNPMETNPPVGVRPYRLRAYQAADLSLRKAGQQKTDPLYTLGTIEPYDWLDLQEVFSARWHGIRHQAGQWLYEPEPNGMGFQPWCHGWGGGGVTPPSAKGFESKYLARGFLHAVMDDIRMWDQGLTASHNLAIRTAFARVGYDGDVSEAVQQLLGSILTGKRDDWWTETTPPSPPQLFQHLETVRNDLRLGTHDPQIGGFRQAGVDTATQQILLSDASQRRFVVLNLLLGTLFSIAVSNMLRLAVNVKEAYGLDQLGIGAHKLRSKDIGRNFRIFVSFENIDPVVHQQQKADARAEIAAGLESRAGYARVARRADWTGTSDEILDDQLEAMPEVQAEMLALRARKRGLNQIAQKLDATAAELRDQRLGEVAMTDEQGAPLVTRDMARSNGNGR